MEENKPIKNEEEVKPPNNPQDAVHEQPLNAPSTDEPIVPATETTSEVEQPQIEQNEIPMTIGATTVPPWFVSSRNTRLYIINGSGRHEPRQRKKIAV